MLALLAFLAVVEVVAVPLFWLFFLDEADPDPLPIVAAIALADIGLAGVGALVAALAQATRKREVLLPVLFLPLAIPLVIGAVTATLAAVDGDAGAPSAGLARPLWYLLRGARLGRLRPRHHRMTAHPSTGLPLLAATVLLPLAIALIFLWVPDDADQGFSQRIFYFHVPVALTTYACFAYAAFCAALYLARRDPTTCARTSASTSARSSAPWC